MVPPASPALARPPDAASGAGETDAQESDEPKRVAPVPLDGVGGHVLLVRADVHREGFVFPSVLFDHQVGVLWLSSSYHPRLSYRVRSMSTCDGK